MFSRIALGSTGGVSAPWALTYLNAVSALPTAKSHEIELNLDRGGDGGCQTPDKTSDKRSSGMNILIAFGTIEGHSRKIAEWIADHVRTNGHNSRVIDVSALQVTIDVAGDDAVMIIAPVHQKTHPEAVLDFIFAHRDSLNANPTAFISVSLSAAFDGGQAEARSYVDRLLKCADWQPAVTHLAAGALRYDEYDYFKEQIIRHVVLRGRGAADVKGDHEFTDWKALGRFVDDFVRAAKR
jgi:menaquinone-dependent protoporphyrinogen oxidase